MDIHLIKNHLIVLKKKLQFAQMDTHGIKISKSVMKLIKKTQLAQKDTLLLQHKQNALRMKPLNVLKT